MNPQGLLRQLAPCMGAPAWWLGLSGGLDSTDQELWGRTQWLDATRKLDVSNYELLVKGKMLRLYQRSKPR